LVVWELGKVPTELLITASKSIRELEGGTGLLLLISTTPGLLRE
jgi:hypothetical protein